MLMRILRRGLAILGIAALATGAVTAPAQTAAARPALWQVSDRDTTVYLFGTIHLLPKNYAWRTPRFDRALAKSQTLVVETIVDNKNPAALVADLARLGFGVDAGPQRVTALGAAVQRGREHGVPGGAQMRRDVSPDPAALIGAVQQNISGHDGSLPWRRKAARGGTNAPVGGAALLFRPPGTQRRTHEAFDDATGL